MQSNLLIQQAGIVDGGSQVSLTSLSSADVNFQPQTPVKDHVAHLDTDGVTIKIPTKRVYKREDAWLTTEKTLQTIEQARKSDRRLNYTMPGIMTEQNFGDPVYDLAHKQFGDTYQQKRHAPQLEDSLQSLNILVKDGLLNNALDMTSRLLTSHGQGYGRAHQPGSTVTQHSMHIWTRRLQLLIAVRNYKLASAEVETFGSLDAADLFWAYYPEFYNKSGSLVPFALRLMHCELPRYVKNCPEALTRCTKLVSTVKKMVKNLESGLSEDGSMTLQENVQQASLKLWRYRVLQANYCLARTLLDMKEFSLACDVLKAMANDNPEHACMILSQAGRVSLQLGHFVSAAEFFQKFNTCCDQSSQRMKAQACMHRGFLSVFYGNYLEASQAFAKAMEFDPENTDAANNYAVCLLYQGNLSDAQASFLSKSAHHLTEATCLNLSTIHELSSSRSTMGKHKLLNQVVVSQGDAFDVACLKL